MKKIMIMLMVLGMLISCTRRTVLEVAVIETAYSPHTYVVTYDQAYPYLSTTDEWFYTKEGVDAFVSRTSKNLSEWEVK